MKFICARQAWHDAYLPDVKGMDIKDQVASYRVEFTVKGADGKIMHDCERAIIQRAVRDVRDADPIAYAWGMFAYTDGLPNVKETAALYRYLMNRFHQWSEGKELDDVFVTKVGLLARLAMHAEAKRDRGHGSRTDMSLPRQIVGCADDTERWNTQWKPVWRRLCGWLQPLPGRALPAVAAAVFSYQEKLAA